MPITLIDRYRGSLLGLACGDAIGTTVEFSPRGSFPEVVDMVGGGPFMLQAGQWTDDTSMALCLATSLIERNGFDPRDQMARYANWWQWGYLSSTGSCFDIGSTVRAALERFLQTGTPYAGATHPHTAGNGSLMRLAPIALYYRKRPELIERCADSSKTTHGAPEAVDCCRLLGRHIAHALSGANKDALQTAPELALSEPKVAQLAEGGFLCKSRDDIHGTGYAVASLESALWCFHNTDSFADSILAAANLGEDADTTAAITGQLAGAFYGVGNIPKHWLETLYMRADIMALADELHFRSQPSQ